MSYLSSFNRNKDAYYADNYSDDGSDTESSDIFDTDTMSDRDITANFKMVTNINSIMKIIRIIEQNFRRRLLPHEIESVKQMLLNDVRIAYNYRRNPTNRFYLGNLQNFNISVILSKIANKWSTIQKKRIENNCLYESDDIHEILKKEIGTASEARSIDPIFIVPSAPKPISELDTEQDKKYEGDQIIEFLGIRNQQDIIKMLNPYNTISYNSIYFDSRLRNISATEGINRFQWDEDNTGSINPGKFSYLGKMRDIIELRVLPFRIPYPSDESADNSFRSITIYFEEFSSQSFIGRSNRRFHIICEASIDAGWIILHTYDSNNGIFRFDKPLTEISKITISFGSPISLINFDPDRLRCTFTTGSPTIVTFTEDHNLSIGDTVSFKDFTSLAPIIDATTIAFINNPSGLIVDVLTDLTFSIPVDTTTITEDPSLSIICIFDSKTFGMAVEFKFIRPQSDS